MYKKTLFIFTLLLTTTSVSAAPPLTKYTPGETIDPNCSPGQTNCDIEFIQGDTTDDAFINNSTENRVELTSKSDGTPRDAGTEFVVTDEGWAGIGTETPTSLLHIESDTQTILKVKSTSATSDPNIFIDGEASRTRRLGFLTAGKLRWTINTSSHAENGGNTGSNMIFYSFNDDGSYKSTDFTIRRDTGNVGIGVTSPTAKLHIQSKESRIGNFYYQNNTTNPRLYIEGEDKGIALRSTYTTGAGDTYFYDGVDTEPNVTIKVNGRVGIGTKSPEQRLHVNNGILRVDSPSGGSSHIQLFGDNGIRNGLIGNRSSNDTFMRLMNRDGDVQVELNTQGTASYIAQGRLGIGTSTPASALHVEDRGYSFQYSANAPSYGTQINVPATITGGWAHGYNFAYNDVQVGAVGFLSAGATSQYLYLDASDGSHNNGHFVLTPNGDIGMGTTSPERTLHISDAMRLEPIVGSQPTTPSLGDLYVDGDTNELCFYNGTSWAGATGGTCD